LRVGAYLNEVWRVESLDVDRTAHQILMCSGFYESREPTGFNDVVGIAEGEKRSTRGNATNVAGVADSRLIRRVDDPR
jgi:hypothetical protein